jgi:crotonobetainyl-CoA:carnitine CoA-transferase CaiB-like acyl-CoA transferase
VANQGTELLKVEHPKFDSIPVVEHLPNYANADSGFETPPPPLGEHTARSSKKSATPTPNSTPSAERGVFGRE